MFAGLFFAFIKKFHMDSKYIPMRFQDLII